MSGIKPKVVEIAFPETVQVEEGADVSFGDEEDNIQDINDLDEVDIKRIENQISHLKRTNKEIAEWDPEKQDEDLQDAIIENESVIAKKEKILEKWYAAHKK